MERWFLTSHERAVITKSVKEMCEVEYGERSEHTKKQVLLKSNEAKMWKNWFPASYLA